MLPLLPNFSTGRLLIIGDVMLDRYWHGSTERISPEAPVPVVKVENDEFRPGGAGNVALNASSLGVRTELIGLIGQDQAGRMLRERLCKGKVHCKLLEMPQHPTISKLRVISRHQQLIRLDFEEKFADADACGIEAACQAALPSSGALVLSDYGKGTLTQLPKLIAAAAAATIPVVVDPKGSYFEPYRGATVLTPNQAEFEAVAGHCPDDASLIARGTELREALELKALLITRSERGMLLLERGQAPLNLPTRARDVYDVTGAGDTVVALLGSALSCGLTLAEATALANLAAGIVVAKLGTASISFSELAQARQAN